MEEQQNPTPPVSSETTQQPQIQPLPPSGVVKKTSRLTLKAIISTLIFLLLAGGAAAGYVYREPIMKLVTKPTPTPISISPTPILDPTSDWKTYDGEGFSLLYPPKWELKNIEDTQNTDLIASIISPVIIDSPTEPLRYNVDIYKVKSIKNYSASDHVEEKIREYQKSIPNFQLTERKKFNLDGINAEYVKGFPSRAGSIEIYAIHNDYLYSIYFHPYEPEFDLWKSKEFGEVFGQILSTFKFTDQEPKPISCEDVKTGIVEIVNGPFRSSTQSESAGEVDVEGKIMSRKSTLFGEEYEMVYIILEENTGNSTYETFLNYYIKEAKSGNTINYFENDKLLFKLGTIDNGTLQTQAAVERETTERITKALNTNEQLKLHLKIPVYMGSGVPADFSYACEFNVNP